MNKEIEDLKQAAQNRIDYDATWHFAFCTHLKAFEVELPLIRIFGLKLLKYKQFICPDCKKIDCKPWRGYTMSIGSAE